MKRELDERTRDLILTAVEFALLEDGASPDELRAEVEYAIRIALEDES